MMGFQPFLKSSEHDWALPCAGLLKAFSLNLTATAQAAGNLPVRQKKTNKKFNKI